ncbi:MAG TPA: hypothetical protein VJ603_07335 [Paucimonas sp.]|nr:hypothetical protein [Paucimonas sp.]HJW55735.1 hypothetical protein [Burkholderiaceae bacterium]
MLHLRYQPVARARGKNRQQCTRRARFVPGNRHRPRHWHDSDPERGAADGTAGPDLGDANPDSDTDAVGAGEHASAGRDTLISDGQDIGTDQVQSIGSVVDEESVADEADRKEKEKPR